MSIGGIDHFSTETRFYERSQAFWQALGFELKAQWGEGGHRACQRETGGGARLVLAEALESPAPPTVHLSVTAGESLNAELIAADAVDVSTPLEATHWGTKWIRVTDPDGREYALEDLG